MGARIWVDLSVRLSTFESYGVVLNLSPYPRRGYTLGYRPRLAGSLRVGLLRGS